MLAFYSTILHILPLMLSIERKQMLVKGKFSKKNNHYILWSRILGNTIYGHPRYEKIQPEKIPIPDLKIDLNYY